MNKLIAIFLAVTCCFQSGAMALNRVDFVDMQSHQIRMENKAQLFGQLVLAEETLRELKAQLAESVQGNFTYNSAIAVRNGSLIAGGVSALAFVGLYIQRRLHLGPSMTMINAGASAVTGIGAIVNVGNALIAQGAVELTGQEIELLESKIQESEIAIQALKSQIIQK